MSRIAGHPSYRSVLRDRLLAALLTGDAVSNVGDGMVVVALPLQVLRIHGPVSAALAIALVEAAPYPAAMALTALFGLGRRRFAARSVLLGDCVLRGATFAILAGLGFSGLLGVWSLAAALAAGSALRMIGKSGRRLAATSLAGDARRYTVNSLLGVNDNAGLYVVGPALGGLIATVAAPAAVFALDALSFAALLTAVTAAVPAVLPSDRSQDEPATASGWRVIRGNPVAARLFLVVFLFDLFYMPVEVALPLLVRGPLHATGTALGAVWTAFGLGALLGAVATNHLHRLPQLALLVAIIGGWAASVTGAAAAPSITVAAAAFTAGGLIYAPFTPVAYSLVQRNLTPAEQQPVLTLWVTGATIAAPLGLMLGGPLVEAAGVRGALYASAVVTAILACIAAIWLHQASRPAHPRCSLGPQKQPIS